MLITRVTQKQKECQDDTQEGRECENEQNEAKGQDHKKTLGAPSSGQSPSRVIDKQRDMPSATRQTEQQTDQSLGNKKSIITAFPGQVAINDERGFFNCIIKQRMSS